MYFNRSFWAEMASKYGGGDLQKAYDKTPLSEIQAFNRAIETEYGQFMVKARATAADIAAVEARLNKKALSVGRASRIKSVLTKVNVALGVLAIFGVVLENGALAKNIASPSPEVQHALDDFLDSYSAAYEEALFRGQVSKRRWMLLNDALQNYMAVAGFPDSARLLVSKYFLEQEANLP